PIGLAAGVDKNGEHLDALAKLGFSFIEVGTVTPRPQLGNTRPRLFRLPGASAIINRMGFNNHGVDALLANISRAQFQGILGINIGKNKDTPIHQSVDDYVYCLRKVYARASYVTINISSPNTPDLRQLQQGQYFHDLIHQLREEQLHLSDMHQRYVPLVVKISPDEDDETLKTMAEVMLSCGLDGMIATNTTCDHRAVQGLQHGQEQGGLSGKPLLVRSTHCLRVLKSVVGDAVTLIGVGGMDSPEAAREKLAAGASLLQIYTGLIYEGPGLVKRLVGSC
ncbi:MAG TPA: quinone-dependent dihydroorotate dehydrogenase, partial [Legionella sp.]|nr:quinone-dependent dihydroorotate dehydrogenase [Legionella sp.]